MSMTGRVTTKPTLIEALWPRADMAGMSDLVRLVVLALIGTALLAISAKIQVPMWPVPMTMQTFAVLVIGMTYGLRLGTATVALYLVEGAAGLPVFASGAGAAYLAGPTGGYLLGFLVAAAVVGWLAEQGWDRSIALTFLANALGTVVIFGLGVAWLSYVLGDVDQAVANGVAPFLLGALVKILLATAILPSIWKVVRRRR